MLFAFLNKPFPRSEINKRSIITNFFVGCFVALFLIVFEPFDIVHWQTDNKELKLMGFGFVSFVIPILVSIVISIIIRKKPVEDNWTTGKEIIVILIILICIAFGNMFYGRLLYIMPFTWNGFLFAFMSVLLIGIFPITVHVLRKHNKLLKINLEQAKTVNEFLHPQELIVEEEKLIPLEEPLPNEPDGVLTEVTKLLFIAENEKDKTELLSEQLLYIESADNYSNIVYVEEKKVKKQLIRSSLKRMESQIKVEHIIRCHRTFIVNLKNVVKIEGNAAGYKLSFSDLTDTIPVSRNYGTAVIEKLKTFK